MTRSERARWTDLQVLAYLWSIQTTGHRRDGGRVTVREVEAALRVSHGRATRSVGRLMREGLADRDADGLLVRVRGLDALRNSGFDITLSSAITYPRDTEAA